MVNNKRKQAYRDGLMQWTEDEVFTAPGGEVVEILYKSATSTEKVYFVELPGVPACAHGGTLVEAINDAREKRDGATPLTDEEKSEYRSENFKFSVALFRRITKACRSGTDQWLSDHGMSKTVTMTLAEFRSAGGGEWADILERKLS